MIHIYYGNGKGKTTCSLGLGMRAYGSGMKVALVQFLKNNKSSELNVLPFDIYKAPDSLPFNPDSSYKKWVDDAIEYVKKSDADMIILDEFLDVIPKFIDTQTAISILDDNKEIIITGHTEIDLLFKKADYITYFEKIKHPYDKGANARKGIEF